MPNHHLGPIAQFKFFLSFKREVQLLTVVLWNVGLGLDYFKVTAPASSRPGEPGLATLLTCLFFFISGLIFYFSPGFRERVLRPNTRLQELTGPWWVVTMVSGSMALLLTLRHFGF